MLGDPITNAPHVPRATAFLEARDMIRNPIRIFEKYRQALGPTFTFHFGGARRAIVSADPDFLQTVLKQNRDNYLKSDMQTARMVEFQGKGLVNIHGQEWLRQRKLMARGFTPRRLADLLPVLQAVLTERLPHFEAEARLGPVDIHEQMVRLTLALVGTSIFGRSMSDAELHQIGSAISVIQSFMVRQIVRPYLIPWYRISGETAKYQRLRRDADHLVLRHIAERRTAGTGEFDLLRILLDEPYHDTGDTMSETQAMIEALQNLVAGNETSSNALTWTFYLLSRHPEHIALIRAEVEDIIGDNPICYDNLAALAHTTRVIHEALRLYPPFWMIDRVALADDEIGGIRIPEGTMVIPYIYGAHHNPEIWDNPETFDPSRFEIDQVKARHPLAYLPFGGGPRVCIGNNMAIMQILLIVATFVRCFEFAPAAAAPVGMRPMMLLRPDGPVPLRFERR